MEYWAAGIRQHINGEQYKIADNSRNSLSEC